MLDLRRRSRLTRSTRLFCPRSVKTLLRSDTTASLRDIECNLPAESLPEPVHQAWPALTLAPIRSPKPGQSGRTITQNHDQITPVLGPVVYLVGRGRRNAMRHGLSVQDVSATICFASGRTRRPRRTTFPTTLASQQQWLEEKQPHPNMSVVKQPNGTVVRFWRMTLSRCQSAFIAHHRRVP